MSTSMKVVEVRYKGNQRNVFLYEGMSSGEVSKLLSACVAAAAPLGSAGRALPQIVALRDPASGTVIPLSLALKHMPSLWSTVELIDDQQVQQGASGPAINVNASGNSNYKQQAAASNARGARPASASQAALPTPIARNAATNAGGAGRPSTAGYAAQQQARPVQRNNYTQQTQTRQAPMHNFVNSSSPDDSLASSPRFDSRGEGGAASPTFSLASSQGSWNDPASGIHVIMSYGELLNVLTGNQAPNTNNGSTPRAIRQGKEVLYCLGVVRPGSEKCEDIFPPFEALALSNAYPNLVFLIIEAELLNGTNIEVPESALPTFQFFLQGHLLGQLVTPTLPQLEKILAASNNLVEENPDMSVEASEEEEDEEDEEERYMAQRAAAQQQQQQSSYSLGEAIDQRSQLTAEERRQLFSDINDEEARWAQLLQASPKANRRRGAASASPSPSASEAEDSDGEGVAAPGLVIRGTKITLQPQPQVAQQRRSANPEQNLRDWFDYQRFDDPAESSGVDESNYEGSSDDGRDDDGTAEYEQAAQAYNRARQAIAAHNAQQQQAQAQNQSHKRKVHPPIASSDEDEASVADGGSEDQGYSSAGNSLTASPVIVGRYGPSSPNGRAITSPAAAAGANNAGLVMSPTEAANIERLLLRADPAVQAAFRAFPELDSVTDVFIRLVHLHITNPAEGAAAAGAGARSGAAASQAATDVHVGTKRKVHPDPRPLADEPPRKQKHLELTEAQKRAAQLKEQQAAAALAIARRHKRPNQQVYASASASEEDEPADSEDEAAAGGAGHARTRSELAAQSHLASQQDRYAALQAQYASIQNEIFSKTVHDLHAQTIISDQQLQCLIYLWTQTEQGSDAIRLLIKQYETEGDELEFMYRLVALVKRFEKGQPVGADDMASPSDSEGPNSPRASASEDSEGQDDDDEEEEVDVGSDGGSPLPSDEEQQYRALMRQFASEQGAAQGSSVSGSEPPSTQASPARVPRSSTKAPQSSPAVAAGSASEQSEQTLSFNLALITRLGESQLLSPSESFVAQQYLVHGHPLMQAAFMAFSYNEDIEDLIETVRDVVGAEAQRQEAGAAKAPTAAAAAPKAAAAAASASQYRLTAEDLLEVLPPWLVSAHGPLIEQLVKRNDAAIVGAWNALMVAVQSKRGPELATEVERMIDAVEQRLVQIAEGVEAQQKQQAQAQSSAAAASSSSASKESPLGDASIADALQIASVLHTGRVFDDEETAVLWALILKSDPVIIAAFDLAREDQQWEELHGTLIHLLEKHAAMKSAMHPLLPLVREVTGVMSQAQVATMKQMMASAQPAKAAPAAASASSSSAKSAAAPQQAASSSNTPQRATAQAAVPTATPISPSIPTSAWSKIVSQFTRSLESLQSAGHLTDSSALKLIDLFQSRNNAVISACQVFELDGDVGDFEDTLRIIVREHEEMALRSPTTQKRMQAQAASQDKPAQTANEKLAQSFAERVQAVDAAESSEFDDEEEEEEDQEDEDEEDDEDEGSDDSALDRLLAKSENAEWGEEDVNALYNKVLEMQSQLTALRQRQIDETGAAAAGAGGATQRRGPAAAADEDEDESDSQ